MVSLRSRLFRLISVIAPIAFASLTAACASSSTPAPMTPLEAALAAAPSEQSRAKDPAYNPPGDDQFTVSDRALEPTTPRGTAPGTPARADAAAKSAKQKIHPAAP